MTIFCAGVARGAGILVQGRRAGTERDRQGDGAELARMPGFRRGAPRGATSNGRPPGPFQRSTGIACTVASAPGSSAALRRRGGGVDLRQRPCLGGGCVPPDRCPSRQPETSARRRDREQRDSPTDAPAHGALRPGLRRVRAGRANVPASGSGATWHCRQFDPLRVRRPDLSDGGGAAWQARQFSRNCRSVRDRGRAAARRQPRRQCRPHRGGPRERRICPRRAAARTVAHGQRAFGSAPGNRDFP